MRKHAHAPKRRTMTVLIAASSTAIAMTAFGVWQASAVHDAGFALQGDVTSASQVDWANVVTTNGAGDAVPAATLPTSYVAAAARADYALPDVTTYATGSKDILPINVAGSSDWQCSKSQNVGDKVDLVNAYSTAVVPTSGAYSGHLLIFFGSEISSSNGDRNAGVWLLQDSTADCSTTGGAKDWTGHHRIGDLLIVSAFTNGGASANVTVYKWVNPSVTDPTANADVGGSLQLAFGNVNLNNERCGNASDDRACAIENSSAITPPWNHPDKDGGALNVNEFYEGGADLTAMGLNGCFSTVVANSRSSQSPDATLFDYVRAPFNTCGGIKVHKFVDNNGNGTQDAGEANGAWSFNVTGPSPSTASVCSGTTDATTGDLTCTNLQPGTYTITETQVAGYYNTVADATVAVNAGSTVSVNKAIGLGGLTTVNFGNICYVDKTFQVNSVPTGADAPSSITVQYAKNGGSYTDLALSDAGNGTLNDGIWSAAVTDSLLQTDTIGWRWFINGDSAHAITVVASGESLQAANPTHPNTAPRDAGCTITNTSGFDLTPLTGHKYKDVNANGQLDAGDLDGAGFQVKVYRASDTTFSSAVATGTSGSNGNFTFDHQLPPGSYVAKETQNTGWRQTEPAAVAGQPGTRAFSIVLNQASASVGEWGNTPLSNIGVTFTPQAVNPGTSTPSTQGQISCTPGSATQSGNSLSSTDLTIGTYTCTVVITDP